ARDNARAVLFIQETKDARLLGVAFGCLLLGRSLLLRSGFFAFGSVGLGSSLLLRSGLLGVLAGAFGVVFSHQLFLGDGLVRHLDLAQQMIDDLFFEDRGAQRSGRTRGLLEVVDDLFFLARELAQLFEQRTLHFVVADLDF